MSSGLPPLEVLPWELSICKLTSSSFPKTVPCFAAVTDGEISLVCRTADVPDDAAVREDGWRAFRVAEAMDLSLTGILAGISDVLAREGVPIFAISTFDTDYVLVREVFLGRAMSALEGAGYPVVSRSVRCLGRGSGTRKGTGTHRRERCTALNRT